MAEDKTSNGDDEGRQAFTAPSISLPKGGGAIRGIGEKFAANPVTGTGSITVPIAASPVRSGFGPQLSLAYDSGSGNGLFGFGWSLSLPSITRKTDKGLPQYRDGDESDTFILSGAEDLVPVLKKQGKNWVPEDVPDRTIDIDTYRLKRYRPRIEGLFARLERWTNTRTNQTHWRSISKDNVVTVYGRTSDSRIEDPNAPEGSPRVFSWLICESYDDRGNAIYYEYKREDSAKIDRSQANERNRTDKSRSANRCLKRIKYGNRTPVAHDPGLPRELGEDLSKRTDWLFEVVFDYGEGHYEELEADPGEHRFVQAQLDPAQKWPKRQDPFSSCRAGFEVRTYRLCRRVLVFHHFPDELGVDDYLVRSTEFTYNEGPIASFITGVIQSGYKRQIDGTYLKKSLPPLEFQYSEAIIQDKIQEIDEESLENLPQGLEGAQYRWADIDGEGLSGILTQQAGAWFYKRNVSALPVVGVDGKPQVVARFAPLERLATIPASTNLSEGRQQLMDLAGDGQLDVVELDSPTPGFYERSKDEAWQPFKPFVSLPTVSWQDPNLKFVDLTGDGHADIFITEDEAFTWYPSLAEIGFAAGEKVRQALDEEKGPKLVFADGTQSIYLADISGDGLTDLVRIRSGEVCYWPNLGYGRFGAKVTMDNAPLFDAPDLFDRRRLRLADIDGSGVTDIIYLKGDGIYIYLNESGNRWAEAKKLKSFPQTDNLSSVLAVDLLGSGTACLVWSSPLPGHAHKPMRYIDLMGGQKPHLLIKTVNNLGAKTHIHYAPSTKFYLADKEAGKPWITRLPFPVHVVERVETFDRISRNRFVTRYAYHHGYFDGKEREFRGFGLVEQWDTEAYAALMESRDFPTGDNIEASSHVPPVLTKTWFHTGTYLGRSHISDFFAGLLDANDTGEYYREPGLTDEQARELLLADTVLPGDLTVDEAHEACRALRGSMLRQEVYALDSTDKEPHPYTVTEQNFTIRVLQTRGNNRHAVFFPHARETLNYNYERNPTDPRIAHALTLEVDDFGNMLKEAAIGYGRRQPDMNLSAEDQAKQTRTLITYTENRVTNAIEAADNDYRTPLPCETRTYELTGYPPTGAAGRFQVSDFVEPDPADPSGGKRIHIFDGETEYEREPPGGRQRRLIEHKRALYRPDDLGASQNDPLALLPLETVESLALPGESYKLAFTPGLLAQVYQRSREGWPSENLLPDPSEILPVDLPTGQVADRGGYVDLDGSGRWWIPSGRVFYSTNMGDAAAQELAHARQHSFLPHRYHDPFGRATTVAYDAYDLLMLETTDPVGNRVTVGERDASGNITTQGNDYRVLQPTLLTDPNRNRSAVAFDALGMVVGTAVMGKSGENLGDLLDGFEADLTETITGNHLDNRLTDPHTILQRATTRLVYDLFAYRRTKDQADPKPPVVYTLARETHDADLDHDGGEQTRIQYSFSYSDGFGREIQKKIRAEPGPVPGRDAEGKITIGADGQPEMTANDVSPRWVGSGWTVFNNKGRPVRQYEPFFTDTHRFEFDVRTGVSPVLFYDPLERMVATLHPNHTYEKVVFDPWRQVTWDVNDTVAAQGTQTGDPRTDPDIDGYVRQYFETQPETWRTWYSQRQGGSLGPQEQDAAFKALIHTNTPTVVHFDSPGRAFLSVAHNRFKYSDTPPGDPPVEEFHCTRVTFDIEGNQREVRDAIEQNGDSQGRIVMRYDYDMLGSRIHQASMEAGERWMLNDVTGQPLYAWDSRDHRFRTAYDPLRRPIASYMGDGTGSELLVGQTVYGETRPDPEANNLRGQVVQLFDQAGLVTSDDYDFKGNLLSSRRQLAQEYKTTLDWSAEVTLEAVTYSNCTRYDALNRPIQLTAPHSDQPGTNINVLQPGYNEANLLEQVSAWLNRSAEPTDLLDPVTANLNAVADIDYDAKGQRTLIDYGNGARTTYEYDPLTFRLIHLQTRRGSEPLQDLSYTYDPVGNITHIRDDAQQTIYFRNKRVEPNAEYTYDALYRLIEATGREHLGQNNGAYNPPTPHSHNDAPRVGLLHRGDGSAMGTYLERYIYDAVGNFLEMQHRGSDPALPGWTRTYAYNEASQLETAKQNNRLTSTTVGAVQEMYSFNGDGYDPHGSMLKMPHLPVMEWDYRDQLCRTDLGGGGTAYYIYNAGGQRVRKVWEKAPGLSEERLYLGGFEIFRRRNGAGTITLERETLHIMDNRQRIGLVEIRTLDTTGGDPAPAQLIRYQFGNHLGSASLELDHQAQIISYEEYTPFGSTSYQAVRNQTETPKRYRYTGKERDEETGFYYHGARYYAPWLGRWTTTDPAGVVDGLNLYLYVRGSPVILVDPNGKNPEPGTANYQVMTMEDPQLIAYLKPMSAEQRGSFEMATSGKFRARVEAARSVAGLNAVYTLPEVTVEIPKEDPPEPKFTGHEPPQLPESMAQPYQGPSISVLREPGPVMVVARQFGKEVWYGTLDQANAGFWYMNQTGATTDAEFEVVMPIYPPGTDYSASANPTDPVKANPNPRRGCSYSLADRPSHVYEILWHNLDTGESGVFKYGLSRDADALNAQGQSKRAISQINKWNRILEANGLRFRLSHGQIWGEGSNNMMLNSAQAHWAERYKVTEHTQLYGRPPAGNQFPRPWKGRRIPRPPRLSRPPARMPRR
jgi:RHS repeat-associated protein